MTDEVSEQATGRTRTKLRVPSAEHHEHPHLAAMRGSHAIKMLLRRKDFRRLYAARLAGQWADGVFQASLAGTVLFNPQQAATPADLAASFAVVLLPYSMVGPFVGVLLDRYSRRRLMAWSNLIRAVLGLLVAALVWVGYQGIGFYVLALLALSLSRFFLSGLPAALPHVAPRETLVSANAFTTTSGTIISLIGGGCAIGLSNLMSQNSHGYGAIAAMSAAGTLLAAWLMSRFEVMALGPDHTQRESAVGVVDVARGMRAGAKHLVRHGEAFGVLLCIAAHRFIFGGMMVALISFFKSGVAEDGPVPSGISGMGLAAATGGAGALLAATVTPAISRAIGKNAWISASYVVFGATGSLLFLLGDARAVLAAIFFLGFAGQGVKVCGDTVVQETIAESFRGRTFAVYDTSFNVCFVVGVILAAFTLPDDAQAPAFYLTCAGLYLIAAASYRLLARHHDHHVSTHPA